MTRTLLITLLLALAGCAANPPPAAEGATPSSMSSAADKERASDSRCIRDTGTRLPPADGGCNNLPGRSYSREDVERTGDTNAGDALRHLDPSVH